MLHISPRKLRSLPLKSRLRGLALIGALLTLLVSSFLMQSQVTHAASYCQVTYSVPNQWQGGFTGNIVIQNTSASTWNNWTLTYTFPSASQVVSQGWTGNFTQSGQNVTVTNVSWNGTLTPNSTTNPGFNASWSGSNPAPTNFAVNGNACNGSTQPTPTPTPVTPTPTPGSPTPTPTSVPPTPTPTSVPPTPTPPVTPTPTPPPGTHVDNPYAGANGYINPDWAASVKAGAAQTGGTLGQQEASVANNSTAVWLDRIAAVTGGNGVTRTLSGHLDAAVDQANANPGKPVVITLVIYDLPNRDCAALASNGELSIANNGLANYKSQYIDPIANILSLSKYSNLRIATIVEPDSLPNLITNLSFAKCSEANSSGAYVQGVQYALNKLHAISNVYTYIDIAHSGWLGWSSNFDPGVNLITNTVKGTTAGVNSVDGFISDTANYVPTTEPYMTANQQVGGNPVRSANFYQWNQYIDEASYDTAMRNAFISAGFPSSIGMLIDTSRNGWGGPNRPGGASSSTDLNTFVNGSKIDLRVHRGNWCNQKGGIGARPVANPAPGFDAYVWIKPPGESDGASQAISNDEGKGADPMCDPTFHGSNQANGGNLTEALPNAPLAGHWFQAEFDLLVKNASPSF
ncbi:glucanase [Dictyobacter alpinus]|uniref:Glucanase n=1 Tax=Dictyobacter alpinus TaxID=2014873 RepID=A0A402BK17_9CHLR|nr:glycoside hydrolase family 6 protein [Dictyobacter alpinus]GCE31698.1 glucanase [Dictyobacter alpinus]